MITLFLLTLLAALFIAVSFLTGGLDVSERTRRFSWGMNRLLLLVPLLAIAVFAVLFLFVLKGRLYERISHAALVLALWLYAARFYWMLISYFKHRRILIMAVLGMIASIAAAIVLTPLDRYVSLIHSFMGAASFLPGSILLAIFYGAALFSMHREKKR